MIGTAPGKPPQNSKWCLQEVWRKIRDKRSDFSILCVIVIIFPKIPVAIFATLELQPKYIVEGIVAAIHEQLLLVSQVRWLVHALCKQHIQVSVIQCKFLPRGPACPQAQSTSVWPSADGKSLVTK